MKWCRAAVAAAMLGAMSPPSPAYAGIDTAFAAKARFHLASMDTALARASLDGTDASDPELALAHGEVALHEMQCDTAAALLGREDVARLPEAKGLVDVARGCARVSAATVVDTDDALGIEIRYQDEADRVLTPILTDLIVKGREMLTRELGVDWPKPTRFLVVRDLLSLSAVTGLPYKAAKTTGTVAVAKYSRVTLLSPRASRHGYGYQDTVVHELAHLAVTRKTRDRAPLWVQEGVAKTMESRWRSPSAFDNRPPAEAIVMRGIERKLDLPFDKLGPSIAMLPSADQAMVAFAQVSTFIRYFLDHAPPGSLSGFLQGIGAGRSPADAILNASGSDQKTWEAQWHRHIMRTPTSKLPDIFQAHPDKARAQDQRDARDRKRLAELLLARGFATEARIELGRVKGPSADEDASVISTRGAVLEALDNVSDIEKWVASADRVSSSFAPWWALRGRYYRATGDSGRALSSLTASLALDPFDPKAACEMPLVRALDPSGTQGAHSSVEADTRLCAAARTWGAPVE